MTRTLLSSGVLMLLLTFTSATRASAIPICPAASMAEYLGFASQGCQFNSLTFSNFEYSHPAGIRLNIFGPTVFPSLSDILVTPQTNPSLGSGGAALAIAPRQGFWNFVNVGFTVHGPSAIVRDDLSAGLQSIANLESAAIGESAVPGGSLGIVQGTICFNNPFGPPPPPNCENPQSLSVAATNFQEIDISGRNVRDFEAGFATPEPATLLLVSAGAAGAGLARWRKRRRAQPLI